LILGTVCTILLGLALMRWKLRVTPEGRRQALGELVYEVAQEQVAEQNGHQPAEKPAEEPEPTAAQ